MVFLANLVTRRGHERAVRANVPMRDVAGGGLGWMGLGGVGVKLEMEAGSWGGGKAEVVCMCAALTTFSTWRWVF